MSDTPEQFAHVVEAIGVVSDYQVQLGHEVRSLANQAKMKACRDYEESEGRENCDLLHRFIVIGGPSFEPGPNQQSSLRAQVYI